MAEFSADVYAQEMGTTSPLFPLDLCPQGNCALRACDGVADPEDDGDDVDDFTDFMVLLAPPPLPRLTGHAQAGSNLFEHLGCATCHVTSLKTGPHPIAALDRMTFHPYSDFLLHDMGALGDGITQVEATGRRMRTALPRRVSAQPSFLHDGRATTLDAAMLAQAGEAQASPDRYVARSSVHKAKAIAFLNAL